jgi:Bacterial Ig domain
MRTINLKAILKAALVLACLLPFAASGTYGQVNLTAAPTMLTLPDGSTVPMWGYSCTVTSGAATCTSLNPGAAGWSPVVITVPTGQDLTIKLTNNLPTPPNAQTGIPTSLMIVGQIGGGLGDPNQATTTPSPDHTNLASSTATWPIAGSAPGFMPPPQPNRVQSFSTEVATGATTSLTWKSPRPGTYLIESGTHPSIQGPMGLYGILVVTSAPTADTNNKETAAGTAYPIGGTGKAVTYDAEVPLIFSELDPVQNNAVNAAIGTQGFSETAVWSGQPNGCGNPSSSNYQTCYPPAVNYSPLYYMINGVAFNKTNPSGSLFSAFPTTLAPASGTGSVLVRFVNAGSRMHVPSIVGSTTTGQTGGSNPTVTGFQLIAEDGNPLPGLPRVQSEVFMAAGKTYDVMINAPAASAPALPVYDRELSLSGNAIGRDAGMLAYVGVNGGTLPSAITTGAGAVARADSYPSVIPGQTLTVSDASKGVIANDTNVYGVQLATAPTQGTLTLNANGTFTYTAGSSWANGDSFTYCANGTTLGTTGAVCATATLGAAPIEAAGGITCLSPSYTSTMATYLAIKTPGVLAACKDGAGYPLTLVTSTVTPAGGLTVYADANGGFTASASGAATYTFSFQVKNSQGTLSSAYTATLTFPQGSGLTVNVLDGADKTTPITDYRWVIEEDRTFFNDPKCSTNPVPSGCPGASTGVPLTFGTNFHTSYMPFVAQGCTGTLSCEVGQSVLGVSSVCDVSNGVCRPDPNMTGKTPVLPGQVSLDPTKRYYISILPGDSANPFGAAYAGAPDCSTPGHCGHGMGGAPIAPNQTSVTVMTQPSPYPPGRLSVFVFEDDFPLNGELDSGGGVDVLAPNEPGLGGFQIHLWDAMGGNGDFTGQMTYDMFNQPLTNSLAGSIDPTNGQDACPISVNSRNASDPTSMGITGMIVTCPKYEADGKTLSPLAGQAVVNNLMPGRWGVVATPGADRIARGEEWLQTNTLDGQKAHDVFTRIGEPSYFQEYGPAGYHVTVGFANPAIINSRLPGICAGTDPNLTAGNCKNTITGKVVGERLSRTPDERLYDSNTRDAFYWTQCYVSVGDPDGEDFAFTKCAADGSFTLSGIPDGSWRVTTFDQWNDQLVDGLSTPVAASGGNTVNMGNIAATQWQTNLYTRTFIDDNKDGISQSSEAGIPFANVAVRLRDGSLENLLVTDFTGTANFNETFPLFSWYVVETDVTRYKNTGTHVVYDAGGPADGSSACGQPGYPACGGSKIGKFLANTLEQESVPANLRVPGSVYCDKADCDNYSIQNGPSTSAPSNCLASGGGVSCGVPSLSTGRIDSPWLGGVEGWQGFPGQNNFIEFGKAPYYPGENGGIKGHVIYASTRPFDDPQMLVQTQWEPLVPHVTINLYQEGTAPDGSQSLTLVDTTQTSSWDDWAQGFHAAPDGTLVPNMSCPGQSGSDLFLFTLTNQPQYLDYYNNVMHGTAGATTPLPYNSQFKCYDGMHNWNQVQPAPYDGMYQFPSVTAFDPSTGRPTQTNCTICTPDPVPSAGDDAADPLRAGLPILPPGKYVVEVVLPAGYELVKEEDKNILIGDNFIAPVTQEFGGLGNIFILPDQASVASTYNSNNAQNQTTGLGTGPSNNIVPGFIPEPTWPCVGEARIVPDYISLYPQSKEVAPFAGATRNLCDRKEVTLNDQMGAIAKFYIYTSTHIASKFTGGITDDFTSEFDPFSPQFGEKFAPPDLPISVRDWSGTEISRVYADHWGAYDGMTYSTWEVNPPNPTGYSPSMMIFCMNDPGPIPGPAGTMINDPAFNSDYSQFCYELPFMPGTTQYLDTPVVPTSAFSEGYNHADCAYPDATPAISEVDGDGGAGSGPYVSAAGNPITIKSLGDQSVANYGYSGPSANIPPFNQKTVTHHYGFGTTKGTVTIGGVPVPPTSITTWNDTTIILNTPSGVPPCAVQQQAIYKGLPAQCGELVITAANGKQSVDTVTITIGGKAPQPFTGTIQSMIDKASPGDLIMIPPGTYNELLLMWKPVRLQGVGATSTIINANTQPAGKLDPWRAKLSCLFGLATNGQPYNAANPFDPTGNYQCGGWTGFNGVLNNPQVDRLPLEGLLGWDTTVNGNLAQLLQEPTLMGAYEGAGITVLAKGVKVPNNAATSYYGSGAEAAFPTGTALLTTRDCLARGTSGMAINPYPSNFLCNPSSIDGLSITDSSQGGGGIFVHAWGHNLQIANNRVYNNIGTLSGGINVGQGESPDAYLSGTTSDSDPGSCLTGNGMPNNTQLPYCFDMNVNVHNNLVTSNTSIGDELFSGTPAGAGGVSLCTGADYYQFNYNWICGNMSTGDGGGFAHVGFIYNGDIEHNTIIFNQSLNPTISTNGGGIIIMGAAPDGFTAAGIECGNSVADADCAPGLPDGTGPNLVINANLIMGNAAESGSGGGLRLQSVNGTEISSFPRRPDLWNSVLVTNNIISNNVAGWDGAGVSLQDALSVNLINNTIVSNDTTASSGVLFNTLGAPVASAPGATNQTTSATTSAPQPAGVVSMLNSPNLTATFKGLRISCPTLNPNCTSISNPYLSNNVIWQNRSYYIGVGALSPTYQQNIVSLFNSFTTTLAPSQPQGTSTKANGNGSIVNGGTGACTAASYWDIGVRGDSGPGNHASGFALSPLSSVITDVNDYPGSANQPNTGSNPNVVSQYCNGSRTPPEFASMGWQVPPGISDATVPNPIFNLTPTATVDEGNNWVNMQWGPLSLTNPSVKGADGNYGGGAPLGNYGITSESPAIGFVHSGTTGYTNAPAVDFYGNPRKGPSSPNRVDAGAVEYQGAIPVPVLKSINPATGRQGTAVAVTLAGTGLSDASSINVSGNGVTVSGITVVNDGTITATFTISANATANARTVSVTTPGGTSNTVTFTVTRLVLSSISPNAGLRGTSVPVTLSGTGLTGATSLNVSGTGINVTAFTAVNDTTVTATFGIASTATTGARTVSVNVPGATTNTVNFTVTVPATLTSITPASAARGSLFQVTLKGSGLTGATGLNGVGSGVTVIFFNVTNDTTATAFFIVAGNATPSTRNVSVTTPSGPTNTVPFTVLAPPSLSSISPTSGARGASVNVTLTGAALTGAATVNAGAGITVSGVTVVNDTTVKATFAIASNATIATRNVTVSTPGGTSNSVTFNVTAPLAAIRGAAVSRPLAKALVQ